METQEKYILIPRQLLTSLFKVLYPTNSKGEVCGQGAHEGKQYMMMFDITRHASTLGQKNYNVILNTHDDQIMKHDPDVLAFLPQ